MNLILLNSEKLYFLEIHKISSFFETAWKHVFDAKISRQVNSKEYILNELNTFY